MDERVPQGAPAQEPRLESVAQPVQAAQPAASQQPTAQSAPAVQPVAGLQPAESQRHYVHHSYIWLGSLRSAGIIIVALGISLFSSMIGSFFEGAGRVDGFIVMVAGLGIAAIIVVIFLLCLLYQWWSYKHLWYELGDEEFSLYSGIFNKKRVHVPYQRVQSVDQHASLWQRVCGVCTVHVDTAGGAAHTAITVPYLRKDQAEHLRMELYQRKRRILGLDGDDAAIASAAPGAAPCGFAPSQAAPAASAAAAAAPAGNVLDVGAEVWDDMRGLFAGDEVNMGVSSYEYGLTNKELVFTGLSNNTGFVLAIIGVLATVVQVVGGVMDVAGDAAGAVANTALAMGSTIFGGNLVLLGIVVCIVVVVALWAISVVGTCIQFGGFKARRRGNRIEVEHGLLQHRIRGVDVDRVQSIIVKQSVIRRLLGYKDGTAGGMMTTQFVSVADTDTVGHAIEVLRELPEDHPSVHFVYVLDEYDKLVGVCSLRTLVLTDDKTPMSKCMYDDLITATPDETEEDVSADIFKYDLTAMPVVDERGTLLGIVTVDDAWDAIEDDVSSDKTKTSAWKWVGIATGAVIFLILYTLVVLQIAGFHWR